MIRSQIVFKINLSIQSATMALIITTTTCIMIITTTKDNLGRVSGLGYYIINALGPSHNKLQAIKTQICPKRRANDSFWMQCNYMTHATIVVYSVATIKGEAMLEQTPLDSVSTYI